MKGVMEESLVRWALNGAAQAPMLCTASDEEALLAGHLVTAGLVRSPEQIRRVARDGDLWQVEADAAERPSADPAERLRALEVNRSACTASWDRLRQLCDRVMALDNTAGLHAVLLSDGERTVVGRDVGRHNALDKAVGKALREGLALDSAVLCSSGRLSLEMLVKAAAAGVPILATRKQVGSLCVAYAAEADIAVCRLADPPVCCSAPWRIA